MNAHVSRMMNTSKWSRALVLLVLPLFALSSFLATAQVVETHSFGAVNKSIPDGNASGMSDLRLVSSAIPELSSVRVKLRVQGEFNGDMYGYLRHVSSQVTNFCVLLNRTGKGTANAAGYADFGFDITLDDAASNGDIHLYREVVTPVAGQPLTGTWQPDGRKIDPSTVLESTPRTSTLSSFAGVTANGEWTLFLADLESGGTNFLVSWALDFSGPGVPEVIWSNPADIVYGTPLGTSQFNASSSVPGTFAYDPPAETILNAGPAQILSVTFTPSDSATYAPVTTNVIINVLKKPLMITAYDATNIYGAPLPIFTASYSGFVNGDTPDSLDSAVAFATAATPNSDVGTYSIVPAAATDANYAIQFASGTLTVVPAHTAATLISSRNPARPGELVTFSFSASSVPPGAAVPVGNVLFKVDGLSTSIALIDGVAAFNTSALTLGTHVVEAEYAGNGNFIGFTNRLTPDQLINTPPNAAPDQIPRYLPYGAKVQTATLIGNDSDADGDPISFLSFAPTSANGGVLTRHGNWISYGAPAGFTNDDSFTYTISDGRGQPVVGIVNIGVETNSLPSPNLRVTDLGNGSYRIRFDGVPDLAYRIEFTDGLNPAEWQELSTLTANSSGQFELIDLPPAGFGQRFYRSVYP